MICTAEVNYSSCGAVEGRSPLGGPSLVGGLGGGGGGASWGTVSRR